MLARVNYPVDDTLLDPRRGFVVRDVLDELARYLVVDSDQPTLNLAETCPASEDVRIREYSYQNLDCPYWKKILIREICATPFIELVHTEMALNTTIFVDGIPAQQNHPGFLFDETPDSELGDTLRRRRDWSAWTEIDANWVDRITDAIVLLRQWHCHRLEKGSCSPDDLQRWVRPIMRALFPHYFKRQIRLIT